MKTKVIPQLQAQIEAAAAFLVESKEDSVEIAGADNMTLVKTKSETALTKRARKMVLFYQVVAGKDYLVCITASRTRKS